MLDHAREAAANRVPREVQAGYPDIPWPSVVALRNRLIHGYDAVDLEIVWKVVREDLGPLVRALVEILGDVAGGATYKNCIVSYCVCDPTPLCTLLCTTAC